MAITECALGSLTDMDRCARLMKAATGAAGIVNAVSEYLAGWTRERVLNIQKVDGGWSPFDERQQPVPVHGVDDVLRICNSVRGQCVALKESGIAPTPELLELNQFLFFARQVVEDHEPVRSRAYNMVPRSSGYRHWSDGQGAGPQG